MRKILRCFGDLEGVCCGGQCPLLFRVVGENDITSFIKYTLGTVLAAYRDFEERMTAVEGKYSSMDLVQIAVSNKIGKFTKNVVMERVPSIGKTSVENALRVLLEEGVIGREGKGKATFYFRKN